MQLNHISSCRVVLFQDSNGKMKSKPQFDILNAKDRASLPMEPTVKIAEDEVNEDHGKEEIFLTWSQVPFCLLKLINFSDFHMK
jgi:hypothetical protein